MSQPSRDLKISLIVPVRNEEASISRFIESLLAQSLTPDEIVIVDGGSTDRTREIIRERFCDSGRVRLIEDDDAYPGRGRNLAIQAARNTWIAMTDAGTVAENDWLKHLAERVSSDPQADVIEGTYDPLIQGFFKECLALAFVDPGRKVGERWARGPSTASIMMKKDVWESLGGFPEHLRACEDLLFFRRLADSRFVSIVAPCAVVRWNIPDDWASVFRRFKTYSLHTLKAGLGGSWHVAVVRMHAVGLAALVLAVAHHWLWILLPVFGLFFRAHRSIRLRQPSLKLSRRAGPHTYALVAALLLWIDAAAFAGAVIYLFKERDKESNHLGARL